MHVILGDQSPFLGGILRAKALGSSIQGEVTSVSYNLHDTDAPWVQTNPQVALVRGGWPPYSSVAARMPYAADAPEMSNENFWNRVRQVIDSPTGLLYLAGPSTLGTIASVSACKDNEVREFVRQMFETEVAWVRTLAGYMGVKTEPPGPVPRTLSSIVPIIRERLAGLPVSVGTTTLFFRENGVRLTNSLPKEHYWLFSKNGERTSWNGKPLNEGQYLVPDGKALALEYAAHDRALGFTSVPYLDEVRKLRDQYVPGLSVGLCEVKLLWELPHDPVSALCEVFNLVQRKRNKPVPEYAETDLECMRAYWRGRPTPIAHDILGGTIRSSVRTFML